MGMGDPGIQDRDHLLSPLEEGTKKCHFPALLKLSANKLVDVLFQYRGIHAFLNTMKFGTMSTAHF